MRPSLGSKDLSEAALRRATQSAMAMAFRSTKAALPEFILVEPEKVAEFMDERDPDLVA